MNSRIRVGSFASLLIVATGTGLAAPAIKPKDEKLPPPTPKQFEESQNNLKQIALAWHNFEAAYAHLPSNQFNKDGKAILSWRVQILPFIEEEDLYRQFKMDEPWDSENNKKLIEKMPKIFAPIRVKADAGMTFYQSFTGKNGLLKPGKNTSLANIFDGTSNTYMVAEAAKPVIWTKPDDMPFDGKDLPKLGGLFDGRFNAVFCDGSVFRFKKVIASDILSKLIDPTDGHSFDATSAVDNDEDKK